MKSHWNHRVMRRTYKHENGMSETLLEIHEVYYNENNQIDGWTENSIKPGCTEDEGLAGLRWELEHMLLALGKPILDYDAEPENIRKK